MGMMDLPTAMFVLPRSEDTSSEKQSPDSAQMIYTHATASFAVKSLSIFLVSEQT